MILPKNCGCCKSNLDEESFNICEYKCELHPDENRYFSFTYKCGVCNKQFENRILKYFCDKCNNEFVQLDLYDNNVLLENINHSTFTIDDKCHESYPCKHYISMNTKDRNITMLKNGEEIVNLLKIRDDTIPAHFYQYVRDKLVALETPKQPETYMSMSYQYLSKTYQYLRKRIY
jgi:hypothetical protein